MRKMILGTDWWTDCDDAVAMRLLSRAHLAGRIQLLGIGINACMEHSVTSLEGFLNLEGVTDIPIGIDLAANDYSGKPPYQKRLAPAAQKYTCNEDAEDAVRLYRRLLAKASEPVEILEIGYPNVLAGLLLSGGDDISPETGLALLAKKVSRMWIMAGKWDTDGGIENNFSRSDRANQAAAYLCRHCPVPITFLGFEIGVDVITGGQLPHDDHLYHVLCDHGSHNGRSSWDPMLVQLALTGDEAAAGYNSVIGTASVDPKTGANHFQPDPAGKHRYVIKAKPDDYYKSVINQLIR